jgi:hypothetical protein
MPEILEINHLKKIEIYIIYSKKKRYYLPSKEGITLDELWVMVSNYK